MVNYSKIADKIFQIVKGYDHQPLMYNDRGDEISNPEEARKFFIKDPNYMVSLDESEDTIRFIRNSNIPLEELESLMKHIKQLAQSYMLKTHINVFGKTISPREFSYEVEKVRGREENKSDVLESTVETIETIITPVAEASLSRLHGSKKTSYQTLESVRLVIRHRQAVDEERHGARSRAIHSIFLETNGERFRFPHNHLPGARAMARHIYEGGEMSDNIGQYIVNQTGNFIKLREFYRYARSNKLINEGSEDIVKVVRENISQIRDTLGKLSGAKSYSRVKEEVESQEECAEEEKSDDSLVDMFTVKKFDEKIGEILPLVNKLVTEKQNWKAKIEEASKEVFTIYREELSEDDIFEFENPIQKLGYKIRKISERVQEESSLSKFVARVGDKLSEGEEISDFEKTVVRNVLENLEEVDKPKQEEAGLDVIENIVEGYGKKLSKYDDRVLFEEETYAKVLVNGKDIFRGDYVGIEELCEFLSKKLSTRYFLCEYPSEGETFGVEYFDLYDLLDENMFDGSEINIGNRKGKQINLKFVSDKIFEKKIK